VLWPKKCSSCNELNSGHRDLCNSCGTALTDKAYNYKVKNQEEARSEYEELQNMKSKINQKLEELK